MAVIALLNCGHYVEYGTSEWVPSPSLPQEECPECGTTETIVTEWKEQWNCVCSEVGCRHSTHHGWNEKGAEKSAADHQRIFGHACLVAYYSYAPRQAKREVRARTRSRRPISLPKDAPPPF